MDEDRNFAVATRKHTERGWHTMQADSARDLTEEKAKELACLLRSGSTDAAYCAVRCDGSGGWLFV